MRRFVLVLPEGEEKERSAAEKLPVRVTGLHRLQELLATTHRGWEAYEKIPVLPNPHSGTVHNNVRHSDEMVDK